MVYISPKLSRCLWLAWAALNLYLLAYASILALSASSVVWLITTPSWP